MAEVEDEQVEDEETAEGPRVVVGFDGSDGSKAAMAFAIEEARMRGALLEVVYAYDTPTLIDVIPPPDYLDKLLVKARAALEEMIEQAVGGQSDLPEMKHTLVTDPAALALINASKGATLLVIGPWGHGGFHELLLGSTSNQCVHHASCPVVVVRYEDEHHERHHHERRHGHGQ